MPRPRKVARAHADIPLVAWFVAFSSGNDYLDDLAPFGLTDPDAIRTAALAAYPTHRAEFLRRYQATHAEGDPWAEREFLKHTNSL